MKERESSVSAGKIGKMDLSDLSSVKERESSVSAGKIGKIDLSDLS